MWWFEMSPKCTLGPSTVWSPAGRALLGGLCGVTLLEEVRYRDRLWKACGTSGPLSLCTWVWRCELTTLCPFCRVCLLLSTHPAMMDSTSVIISPNELFYELPWPWCLFYYRAAEKELGLMGTACNCPSDAAPRRTSVLGVQTRPWGTQGRDELGKNLSQESKT